MDKLLTLKDKKIIYELDFDARMPLTILGKKVGLSKQALKYRLEKLQEKKIIQGFYADINASRLGMSIYLVYLKFHHFPAEVEKRFISYISKQKSVGVNASVQGEWDYCVGIWAENVIHFKDYYRKIMSSYEKYIKNKTVMIETDFYYSKPKQIFDKKEERYISMEGEMKTLKTDEKDKRILSLLSKDARISLVELEKKVGLTANAIKLRIRNLEKENVILGYRVMIDYSLLGFLHYRIFLHLDSLTEAKEKEIILFLKNKKPVVSITQTIGYCDLEFRAVVNDITEFYNLIESVKEKFPEMFNEYNSILYYKFHQALNYFPFD